MDLFAQTSWDGLNDAYASSLRPFTRAYTLFTSLIWRRHDRMLPTSLDAKYQKQ